MIFITPLGEICEKPGWRCCMDAHHNTVWCSPQGAWGPSCHRPLACWQGLSALPWAADSPLRTPCAQGAGDFTLLCKFLHDQGERPALECRP